MVDDIVDALVRGRRIDFRTEWDGDVGLAQLTRVELLRFAAVAVVWRHPSRPPGANVGWILPGLIN